MRAAAASMVSWGRGRVVWEGKGRRCLGKEPMPRATSCPICQSITLTYRLDLVEMQLTHHSRPHVPPTPSHAPPSRLPALHKFFDSPVPDSFLFEFLGDRADATIFAKHAGVPLDSLFETAAFFDHPGYECDFAAGGDHFDFCACAGRVWRAGFGGGGGEEFGGGGVERGIADCEVDARKKVLVCSKGMIMKRLNSRGTD